MWGRRQGEGGKGWLGNKEIESTENLVGSVACVTAGDTVRNTGKCFQVHTTAAAAAAEAAPMLLGL